MAESLYKSHGEGERGSSVAVQLTDVPLSFAARLERARAVSIALLGLGVFWSLILSPLVILSPALSVAVSIASMPAALLLIGCAWAAYWARLAKNNRHHLTDQCFAWEVTCYGTDSAVALTGLDTCDGWREIEVCCK
ncbi:MAG: hypothetical protein ACIAQU_00290, partial [Phycisphaerales bacterium JB064]